MREWFYMFFFNFFERKVLIGWMKFFCIFFFLTNLQIFWKQYVCLSVCYRPSVASSFLFLNRCNVDDIQSFVYWWSYYVLVVLAQGTYNLLNEQIVSCFNIFGSIELFVSCRSYVYCKCYTDIRGLWLGFHHNCYRYSIVWYVVSTELGTEAWSRPMPCQSRYMF